MKLIDNRYKISNVIVQNLVSTVYEVNDLWNNDKKFFLKLFNLDKQYKVLDNFINNFISISNIKHINILSNENFNIVQTIDRNKVNINQYYYTVEYVKDYTLDKVYKELTLNEKILVVIQLCRALDFLHFKGIAYKYLCPSNIFVNKKGFIKVRDLATVLWNKSNINNNDIRHFIAPEVILYGQNSNKKSDFYSLGMIIEFLFKQNKDELTAEQNNFIKDLVDKLTKQNVTSRQANLNQIMFQIIKLFQIDFSYDLRQEREKLNFNTKIVGRTKEIKEVLNIDKQILNNLNEGKVILVEGESGIGKTRFLKELYHVFKFKGRQVYYSSAKSNENEDFKLISDILRQIMKDASNKLLNKYGNELVKILPELRFISNINPSPILAGQKEKFRLFYRIFSFIRDFVKNKPAYIIMDDFDRSDKNTLNLIKYFIRNIQDCPLCIIISYNSSKINNKFLIKHIINKYEMNNDVVSIRLSKLGLYEIGEMVQNILGINYKPLKFSAFLLKETLGSPRLIELILKNFYVSKKLYINKQGFWDIKSKNYSDIYVSIDVNDVLKEQLNFLKGNLFQIAKTISIFNNPVSKNIILKMTNLENDQLNKIIKKLVSVKILDERVGDLGYSYTFYDIQLKKVIYNNISKEEKQMFHKKASEILEKTYTFNDEQNIEELVYHLALSNQFNKAINYIINQAKSIQKISSSQAIYLWEKAYEFLKDKNSLKKLEIIINIGNLFSIRGENDKALKMYNEALNDFTKLGQKKYIIKTQNCIAKIYYRRNLIDEAYELVMKSKQISNQISYKSGILQSMILINKIQILKNKFDKVIDNDYKCIGIARDENNNKYLGELYNQLGIVNFYKGNMKLAKSYFEISIKHFCNAEDYIGSTKPINNIGDIYSEYYGNINKAMKYFNRGLEICNKYGYLESQMIFLNNIGEIYIRIHDYERAKIYIQRARNIAVVMEDKNLIFLANINLGQIYLKTGQFINSFNCFNLIKEEYEKYPSQSKEIMSQYYNFLGEFYRRFGNWEKAYDYSLKAKNMCSKFYIRDYLILQSRIIVINYFKDGIVNKEMIEIIREEYRKRTLNYDRRKNLLEFCIICIMDGDYNYARNLLEEDEKFKDKYFTKGLDFLRKLLIYWIDDDEKSLDKLLELEVQIRNSKLLRIKLLINLIIGNKFLKSNKCYKALDYYLEILDVMYKLTKEIPNRKLQLTYLKAYDSDKIKKKIARIFKNVFKQNIKITYLDKIKEDRNLEDYFNLNKILGLINYEEFYKINYNSCLLDKVNNIEDLIEKFTNNYKLNLQIILEYLMKQTLAQKGFICKYNDNGDLDIIAKLNYNDIAIDNDIIELVKNRGEGIIATNCFEKNYSIIFKEILSSNIKGLICIPIIKPNNIINNVYNDRRKKSFCGDNKIIGYIYLETDRLINKFNKKGFNLVKSLSYLIFINIDNYNLKVLSSMDKLTGTYTRKYFDTLFIEVLNEAKKNNNLFSVLMIDIDKFKNINDKFGHRKGDEILNKLGNVLVNNIRNTDIVARYGGEEFIVLLKNVNEYETKSIVEKLREKIKEKIVITDDYKLTVSIGISLFPKHSQFKEELVEKADQALYCAKKNGRDKVVVWKDNITNDVNRVDRLAGIISGNPIQDERNILSIIDIIDLMKKDINKYEKISKFLLKVLEIIDAEYGMLFTLDNNQEINKIFFESHLENKCNQIQQYNKCILNRVIKNRKGEFLIDWNSIQDIDIISGVPNWKSVIVIPIIYEKKIKGVIYLCVSIKQKEFNYNDYNFVNTVCAIISSIV